MSKILFLTTHNLATNPRLVKEIKLALQHNYEVEVICYIFRNWSYEINQEMLQEFQNQGVKFHCIEAGRKNKFKWFIAVANEKYARLLSRIIPLKNLALANAVSRRNVDLLNEVNKISSADWIIGHNPGALYAAHYAGKKLNSKIGFDVEDYHPGEGNDKHLQKLTKSLMQQVLPKMDYVSFAAPLIMDQVKKDVGNNDLNWFTILNYFPKEEFSLPLTNISRTLKLVWFSQNINAGRGLEFIINAVKANPTTMELHLYGNININFKENRLLVGNIFIHEPMPQKELHRALRLYDVGLALEPAKDLNNDLAISNKILAYLQSGLYILATNTSAQKSFIEKHPQAGVCFDINNNNSATILNSLESELDFIRQHRMTRFEECKYKNWENESMKLIKILNRL